MAASLSDNDVDDRWTRRVAEIRADTASSRWLAPKGGVQTWLSQLLAMVTMPPWTDIKDQDARHGLALTESPEPSPAEGDALQNDGLANRAGERAPDPGELRRHHRLCHARSCLVQAVSVGQLTRQPRVHRRSQPSLSPGCGDGDAGRRHGRTKRRCPRWGRRFQPIPRGAERQFHCRHSHRR